MNLGYSVRIYNLHADGKIEPLLGSSIEYFGGSCPNVGDTMSEQIGLDNNYRYFNVQRRMFVDTFDGDQGWVVIVREVEGSPLLKKITKEWIAETNFFRRMDEREKEKQDRASKKRMLKLAMAQKKAKRDAHRRST